jgi:hypothetical protein
MAFTSILVPGQTKMLRKEQFVRSRNAIARSIPLCGGLPEVFEQHSYLSGGSNLRLFRGKILYWFSILYAIFAAKNG